MSPIQRAGYAQLLLIYMLIVTEITFFARRIVTIEYGSWLAIMLGWMWMIIREDFTDP